MDSEAGKPNGETTNSNGGAVRSPRLHGDLLATSLLGFLRDWNAHGYQLAQRLAQAGLPPFDVGTIYRTLRQLEKSGLVSSMWDTSESGPARRTYALTQAGDAFLTGWMDILRRYESIFRGFSAAPKQQTDPSPSPFPKGKGNGPA